MNTTNVTVGSTKDTSKLQRARFRPGMLLESEDLELLNTYTRDLSRLLFGSLFGCGVICGLVVKADPHCDNLKITVGAGVALGCSGEPIQVPKDVVFTLDDSYRPQDRDQLWVELCGTTKCCTPRTAMCSSDDDETTSECSRERDGFEIKVVIGDRPPCVCGCPDPPANQIFKKEDQSDRGTKLFSTTASTMDCECADPESDCYKDHYDGICGCHCDDCSDCDCKCILLARIDLNDGTWTADHSVRRFIRPVLMRDPQVYLEQQPALYSTMKIGQPVQQVNAAAYEAAGIVLQQRAVDAAQETAIAGQEAAIELGKRAADEVIRPIIEEATRLAVDEALKKQLADEALKKRAAAKVAADQQATEQANAINAGQQPQKASQKKRNSRSKGTKASKSTKSR